MSCPVVQDFELFKLSPTRTHARARANTYMYSEHRFC